MNPAGPNADQLAYWNSPAAAAWTREQERLDRSFVPLTAALVEAAGARPGERVVDVGCGCGDLSLILADRVGVGGSVLGLDISRPMLDLARRRDLARASRSSAQIEWREADAAIASFAPEPDLLASRFGTMFFDDPEVAFRHMRTGMAARGRLAILCWQEPRRNAWAALPMGAIAARYGVPEAPLPDAPGPFAFADRDRVTAILTAAGWRDVAADPVEAAMLVGLAEGGRSALDDALHHVTSIGPVPRLLRERPEISAGVQDLVREALSPLVEGNAIRLPAACWLYTGRA